MAWDDLGRMAGEENRLDRERLIGIYIGILAVLLAICSMGGGNAAKNATLTNIEASNTWAFFQAKNMRRQVLRLQSDALELQIAANPGMPEAARDAIKAKVADYKKQDEVLTKDPDKEADKREGLDQLWEKGKRLEAERDQAMRQDPYFDYAQASLQIAIVLASVSLIATGSALLAVSGALAALGTALMLNGFFLVAAVPGIG